MNRLLKAAAALVCAVGLTAFASTVTATVTDTDLQTWNNCTYTATLVISGQPGVPVTSGGVAVTPAKVAGSCSATGVITVTLADTSTDDQAGSAWVFLIQSNTSAPPVTVTTTVIGSTPNLSPAFSQLAPPRFPAVADAFGYLDGEVVSPLKGARYYNVTLQVVRQWNGAAWTGTGGSATPSTAYTASSLGTLYGVGDSTMAGSFSSRPDTSTFAILARDFQGNASNLGSPGAMMSTIVDIMVGGLPPVLNTTALPVIYGNGGINDANSIGATTGSINNYKLQLAASVYWPLPQSYKVMASTCTLLGFGATYNGPTINAGVPGTAKQSITVGDTLTCTGTAASTKVGIIYSPRVTGTGTFTVALTNGAQTGVLQTDTCSGTTTFSGFGCNSVAVSTDTIARQEFSVVPGPYTVVFTVTGTTGATNIVSIVGTDSTPASSVGLPPYIMSGVIRQLADVKASDTLAFDSAAAAVIAQAVTDNLKATFVNVRGGTAPGVNITTDLAASTTACPALAGSQTPLHPNDCGYLNWAQTIENSVTGIFNPGSGKSPTLFGPVTTYSGTSGNASLSFASWNSNKGGIAPTSALFAPVYCSFLIAGSNFYCTGINWSATQSTFTNAMFSNGRSAIQFCSGAAPNLCTDSAWWDTAGEQHNKGSVQLGTTVAPTCDATKRGQIQYTAGGVGVKDIVQVCAKDAADVYAYRPIY